MTTSTHHSRPMPEAVVRFTNKGERALDALAATIVNRMARTPEGIAQTLAEVFHTPIDELAEALSQIADQLDNLRDSRPDQTAVATPRDAS